MEKSNFVFLKGVNDFIYAIACAAENNYPDDPNTTLIKMRMFGEATAKHLGQWLEAAGFNTGCKFDVRVMPGCILLTTKLPEPEEPALLQSLRRVCKLSARKQQQVQEFINVISAKSRKQG